MKKFLCVLISFLIIFSSVLIVNAEEKQLPLDVCVISDVHFKHASIRPEDKKATDETPLYFRGGITGQMDYESYAIFTSFYDTFLNIDTEILLVSGDITDGKQENHEEIAELFKELESKGKKVFVINGNHDILDEDDTGYTSGENFSEIYGDFGYNEALSRDADSLSYTAKLQDGYRLLAIDSCIPGEDKGKISKETSLWIDTQLQKAKEDDVKIIAMMHHSLLSHTGMYSITGMKADGADSLAQKLADADVNTVFSGHFHANDISSAKTDKRNVIHDIMTGSLITYPFSYRTVKFYKNEAEIKTDYIKDIDTSLLPDNFSEKEINEMEKDFLGYSRGFFLSGIKNWITKYLGSADKICRMLKIDRDSSFGKMLDEKMPYIAGAFTMPLYGEENSLESIAKLAGHTIEKSEYNSIAEIAGEIMCSLFSGDETLGKNSKEAEIIVSSLHSALTYISCNLSGKTDEKSLQRSSKFTHFFAFGDKLLLKCIYPILNGFTSDAYSPEDLNVTLSFAVNDSEDNYSPITFFQKVSHFFKSFRK